MSVQRDSWDARLAAAQAFHDKHRLRQRGGEELAYRVALVAEELGEISSYVTKGKPRAALADLRILVMGTDIAADLDLDSAFWHKMGQLMQRESRVVDRRVRVSDFRDVD